MRFFTGVFREAYLAGRRFFFATILALISGIPYDNLPLVMIGAGMAVVGLFSVLHALILWRLLFSVESTFRWDAPFITEGERAAFSIALEPLPRVLARRVGIELEARWHSRVFSARSRITPDGRQTAATMDPLARGRYAVERCRIFARDALLLIVVTREVGSVTDLDVVPRVEKVESVAPRSFHGGVSDPQRIVRDRNETLIEQRPYTAGDNVRRLAWNVYAHTGELFVRIGEEVPPSARTVRVLVDVRRPDSASTLDTLDTLCRMTLGLLGRLVGDGYIVSCFLSNGVEIPVHEPASVSQQLAGVFWDARRFDLPSDSSASIWIGITIEGACDVRLLS